MNNEIISLAILFIMSIMPLFEGRYTVALILMNSITVNLIAGYAVVILSTLFLALVLSICMKHIDNMFIKFYNSDMRLFRLLGSLYVKYISNLRKRAKKYVDKYGVAALTIFVAIPVPATGVWTGAAIAYIFGFDKFKAFVTLSLGGIISIILTSIIVVMFGVII